jgi:hypothetical protein
MASAANGMEITAASANTPIVMIKFNFVVFGFIELPPFYILGCPKKQKPPSRHMLPCEGSNY